MYETCGLGEREKNTRCGLWRLYWSVLKTIQVCVYVPPRKTFLISRACKGLHQESSANSSNEILFTVVWDFSLINLSRRGLYG